MLTLSSINAIAHPAILTGSNYAAPPALWGNAGDVQFSLLTMSPNERYSKLRIQVSTVRGSGDYAGKCCGAFRDGSDRERL